MRYVKLSTIENYLTLNEEEFTEIEEHAFNGLRLIGIAPILEHTAEVLEVNNYKADLPSDLQKIRFASYLHSDASLDEFNDLCSDCVASDDNTVVCTACADGTASLANYPVGLMERQACRIRHQGIVYIYDYYNFVTSRYYANNFELMLPRRTKGTRNVVCKECQPTCSTCSETYEILHSNQILTSFECGTVCIDYFRYAKDDDGDFLIPDDALLHEAIANYVSYKHWEQRMNRKEQGAERLMVQYMDRWRAKKVAYQGSAIMNEFDPVAMNQIIYKNVKEARSPKTFNYNSSYTSTNVNVFR